MIYCFIIDVSSRMAERDGGAASDNHTASGNNETGSSSANKTFSYLDLAKAVVESIYFATKR
jgi:hypothetical protein